MTDVGLSYLVARVLDCESKGELRKLCDDVGQDHRAIIIRLANRIGPGLPE